MRTGQQEGARRALAAAVVAASLAAAAGSQAQAGPTPAVAAQAGARGAVYGGRVLGESPYPVVLQLSPQRTAITRVVTAFHAPCNAGLAFNLVDDASLTAGIGGNGTFAFTRKPDPYSLGGGITADAQIRVRGTVKGRSVSGTVALHVDEKDPGGATVATCDTAAPFRARSAPGRVYAGSTDQNGPVVLELRPDRRRVSHLRVAWQSSCASGAEFQVADDQGPFAIKRKRFGAGYDADPYPIDGGGQGVDHYAVRGKVRARKASGSFRVTTTERDGDGAETDTCDSGPLALRLRSG